MGLWIEIPIPHLCSVSYRRQPLRWGCGLKSDSSVIIENSNLSASAMGLWIEITQTITWWSKAMSASAMGLWIEIVTAEHEIMRPVCQPLRWGCGLK